jgi:hypothetical protein
MHISKGDAASPARDAVSPMGDFLASPKFRICDTTQIVKRKTSLIIKCRKGKMEGRKTQKRKHRKINIECNDVRRLRYFIFTTVTDSSKFHSSMFIDKISSVFRSFTYYIHARTKKEEDISSPSRSIVIRVYMDFHTADPK